jgi:hypothetical protein
MSKSQLEILEKQLKETLQKQPEESVIDERI